MRGLINRTPVSRSEREIALTPSQRLDRLGYDLVDARIVGRDPEMLYVEYIITGRSRRDGSYAVWTGFDWISHPNPGDRSCGFAVQSGAYGLSRAEAAEEEADRFRRHSKARWEPVSGSRASPRIRTVSPAEIRLPGDYSEEWPDGPISDEDGYRIVECTKCGRLFDEADLPDRNTGDCPVCGGRGCLMDVTAYRLRILRCDSVRSASKAKAPVRKPASKPKPKTVSKTAKPKSQTSRKTTSRTKGARR